MSDWAVGDLALCVDDEGDFDLVAGRIYRVTDVFIGNHLVDGEEDEFLSLVELPPGGTWDGYVSSAFRKIRPDEHEACEPEFVTLLKRTKVRA